MEIITITIDLDTVSLAMVHTLNYGWHWEHYVGHPAVGIYSLG